ncbi:hypothetical protein [Streptomyces cacaoi]
MVSLAVAIALALVGWAFTYMLDYFSTERTARHAKDVDEKIEKEEPAFTASTRVDPPPPDSQVVLFDHPLTSAERKYLTGLDLEEGKDEPDLKNFVKSHHGKKLAFPGDKVGGYSKTWLIDFFSGRTESLTISGVHAENIDCKSAAAKAMILFPPQGVGDYSTMLFKLPDNTPPIIGGGPQVEGAGEPYFSHKKIDLGSGATPGGVRMEVSSGTQDCAWEFEAEYRDSQGAHEQRFKDGKKRFFTRGVPARPQQVFMYAADKFSITDCQKKREEGCDWRSWVT